MIAARLTDDAQLQIAGNIDTRLPLVTDGLVAHYPMDGTTKGIANLNIIDYSTWTIGTSGSQTGFSQNGDGNSIVEDTGPFGEQQAIWQSLGNDVTSDADGGWNSSTFSIDKTKKYRYSVWIKRKVAGNGTAYLGCQGGQVYNITADTINTNPYFWAAGITGDDWRLYVSYVFPYDIGTTYPSHDGGIYTIDGTKLSSINAFKASPTATTNYHRSYLYYSTLPETNQQWAYPRVDLCDGTEPSLDDLIHGEGNVTNPSTDTNTTITNDYVAVEEATTNVIPDGDFSNGLKHPYAYAANGVLSIVYDNELGRNVLKHTNISGLESYSSGSNTPLRTTTVGDVWTNTLYVRTTTLNASVQIYTFELNSSNVYVNIPQKTIIINPSDGWVKLSFTHVVSNATTVNIGTRVNLNTNGTVFYRDWQLEQKSFATEYVNGSRPSQGSLYYKVPTIDPLTESFSLNIEMAPNGHYGTSSPSIDIPGIGYIWHYYPTTTNTTVKYVWDWYNTGTRTYEDLNSTIPFEINKFWTLTITWDTNTIKFYRDGVYWEQDFKTSTCSLSNISTINFNYIHSRIKNLSIYNRALSDSEIKTLVKGTHSITSTGLITKSITSRPVVPSDANYFPLDLDGKSEYGDIVPSENTAIYTDGDAYVGGNSLEYNFNSSIGLSWAGDWSICYFKKPIGTSSGSTVLTSYNIESVGCNSNSIGGGYVFWGKASGSDTIYGATNSAFTPSDYFGNWHCITMVKSGSTITVETWLNDKVVRTRTIGTTTTVANYYVTQYGYDFKLGGWDNNNGCYAHFRDLIVLPRAMTQTELDNYNTTKMRATADGLQIGNSVESGKALV